MRAHEQLQCDHAQLRAQLAELERMLREVPLNRAAVAGLTDTFCACLRAHTEHEEQLAALSINGGAWPRNTVLQHLQEEHENQRTRLAILHQLLSQAPPVPASEVAAQAMDVVEDLRAHMAEEERALFPALETAEEETVEMLGLA